MLNKPKKKILGNKTKEKEPKKTPTIDDLISSGMIQKASAIKQPVTKKTTTTKATTNTKTGKILKKDINKSIGWKLFSEFAYQIKLIYLFFRYNRIIK